MRKVLAAGMALSLMAYVHAAETEDSKKRDDRRIVEEIVVTSTYRETNLMETPGAISAISAGLVEDLGAQSMEDVFTLVPGLNMEGTLNGQSRYTVRGISSQSGEIGYAPAGATIGVYLDGTPVTAALGPDKQTSGTLFDIQRVEVLKGPQGTLFGEGSQGGTIRYIYNQPDSTEFDYGFNASVASMSESDDLSHRLDAMVNVPISDNLALRVTGWTSESAGFIDNLTPLEEDFNTGESNGVRAALRFDGDRFSITGTIHHTEQETTGGSDTFAPYTVRNRRIPGLEPESKDEIDIYTLVAEVEFGFATFHSLTSYTDREITNIVEDSGFGATGLDFFYGGSTQAADHPLCAAFAAFGLCPGFPGILNAGSPPGMPRFTPDGNNVVAISGIGDNYSERWVQEFRLVSPADQRLRWTAGLFWKDSEDHTQNQQQSLYFPGREAFGVIFDSLLMVPANTHTDFIEEYAVFGEVSFDITEELEITAGVRVSELTQDFTNTNTGTEDTPVSPKVVLTWTPREELLLYASYSNGFRPGNVSNNMEFYAQQFLVANQALLADPTLTDAERQAGIDLNNANIAIVRSNLFFDGDELDSFEIGAKATLLDGRVAVQGAVYRIDWQDMIVPVMEIAAGNDFFNSNTGEAEILGVEVEVNAYVTDSLNIRVAADHNDSEVTDAGALTSSAQDGNELIHAPNKTLSVGVNYSVPVWRDFMLDFYVDRAWVGEQFTDVGNTNVVPSYKKSNARITLRSPDQKWRVALFANNLTNEEILRTSTPTGIFYWQNPRQVGIEFGYRR